MESKGEESEEEAEGKAVGEGNLGQIRQGS